MQVSDELQTSCKITLHCKDGSITRTGVGTEPMKVWDSKTGEWKGVAYGNVSSNSFSMAFRRAFALFGFGLYIYDDGKSIENPNGIKK